MTQQDIVMTSKQLMQAADSLTGIHPGMMAKEIQEALHSWSPSGDRGYVKRAEFKPIKSGLSEAQKRYSAKKEAARNRVRAFRLRQKAGDGSSHNTNKGEVT